MQFPGEIDSAYYYRRQNGGGILDKSTIAVRNFEYDDLPFTDEQLQRMTDDWSKPVLGEIPRFKYWDHEYLQDRRFMATPDNLVGHQQRSFDFYWLIRECVAKGHVALSIGAAGCAGPAALGVDKYHGKTPPPPVQRYGSWYDHSHMEMDAEQKFPFFDGKFGAAVSNHVIEHLHDTEHFIWECLRVVRYQGVVTIVQPDMAHMRRGACDPSHVQERSADEFLALLRKMKEHQTKDYDHPDFEVLEHNTFDNMFSFNTVLRRTDHANLEDRYGCDADNPGRPGE